MTVRPRERAALLEVPVTTALLRLAVPLAALQLFTLVSMLVNRFWIGRLGTSALAAAGLVSQVLPFLAPLLMTAALGAMVVVARRVGEGRREEAAAAAGQALWLGVLLSALVTALGLAGAPALLRAMQAEPDVVREGAVFLRILMVGTVTNCLLFTGSFALQGAGEGRVPLYAVVGSGLLNFALDPVLIYGWGPAPALGLAGSAWATVASQAAGSVYVARALGGRASPVRIDRKALRIRLDHWWTLLRIGVPGVAEMAIRSACTLLLTALIAREGTATTAAHTTGFLVLLTAFLPCIGIAQASGTVAAQALGAGLPERAFRAGLAGAGAGAGVGLGAAAVFTGWGEAIVALFDPSTQGTALGAEMLRVLAPVTPVMTAGMVLGRTMGGAGATRSMLVLTAALQVGLQLPLGWVLSERFGVRGVWWAMAATGVAQLAVNATWYGARRWMKIAV